MSSPMDITEDSPEGDNEDAKMDSESSSSSSSSSQPFQARQKFRIPTKSELDLHEITHIFGQHEVDGFPLLTLKIWSAICARLSKPMVWAVCTGGQWCGSKSRSGYAEIYHDGKHHLVGRWLFHAFVDNEPGTCTDSMFGNGLQIWRVCEQRDCIAPSCALEIPVQKRKQFVREDVELSEIKELRDWFKRSDLERVDTKVGQPYKLTTAHAREILQQTNCAIWPSACTNYVWNGARHKTPFIRFRGETQWWSVVWLLAGRAVTLQETLTKEGALQRVGCKFSRCFNPACYRNSLQPDKDRLVQYKLPHFYGPLGPPMPIKDFLNSLMPKKSDEAKPEQKKRKLDFWTNVPETKPLVFKKVKSASREEYIEPKWTDVPSPYRKEEKEDAEAANWVLQCIREYAVATKPAPLFCRDNAENRKTKFLAWTGPKDEKTGEPCIRVRRDDSLALLVKLREQLFRYFVPPGDNRHVIEPEREAIHVMCGRSDCIAPTCCMKVPIVALAPLMPTMVSSYMAQLTAWLQQNRYWKPMHNDEATMLRFATAVQCGWKFGTCSASMSYHGPQQIFSLLKTTHRGYVSTASWLAGVDSDSAYVFGLRATVERWKLWQPLPLEQMRMPKCKCWTCINPRCFERIELNLPLFSLRVKH
jgi:hypothetical protein